MRGSHMVKAVGRTAILKLADGTAWRIAAETEGEQAIVLDLAQAMQLGVDGEPTHDLLVSGKARTGGGFSVSTIGERTVVCSVGPEPPTGVRLMQLMFANLGIVLHTEHRGGVLVHGALAQCGTWGVILAGPGGIGKTTASDRIRSPWRSLSDDATFVVRDTGGVYWAHPWPTWSRFIPGGAGGTWNVECPVPLHSIFFLSRSSDIRVSPVQGARAVCLLTESVEQASGMVFQNMSAQAVRTHRLQRFDNICALAKSVPCYILHLSLTGRFWEKIEEALAGDGT